MPDFNDLSLEELQAELKKYETRLQDTLHERAFLGKQGGMHIGVSEFERLDREAERYKAVIEKIKGQIAISGE